MKTFLPILSKTSKVLLVVLAITVTVNVAGQSNQELVFKNASKVSGSTGADGTIYKFASVTNTHDAMVKIVSRSSADVRLRSIDQSSSGYDNAFQPQVEFTGTNGAATWWMEFELSFLNKANATLQVIPNVKATAIDIDGDNSTLNEWVSFYNSNAYTVESNTAITVSDVLETVAGNLVIVGKKFDGSKNLYTTGVDTTETSVMTTVTYLTTNTIRVRVGGTKTGNSSMTNRMYSIWFKNFAYIAPITLPVKLISFNAILNNSSKKVDLTWVTEVEKNASHFVIERSTDGENYSDAGVMFAYGNSTDNKTYRFSDNISSITAGVIYYRLRTVDIDGKFDYSTTRLIRITKQNENIVSILTYPNPVTNELRITIPANWQGKKVSYAVYSLNGQLINSKQTATSNQTETLDVSKLASGMSIVRVTCEGETAQQKIIKQ